MVKCFHERGVAAELEGFEPKRLETGLSSDLLPLHGNAKTRDYQREGTAVGPGQSGGGEYSPGLKADQNETASRDLYDRGFSEGDGEG